MCVCVPVYVIRNPTIGGYHAWVVENEVSNVLLYYTIKFIDSILLLHSTPLHPSTFKVVFFSSINATQYIISHTCYWIITLLMFIILLPHNRIIPCSLQHTSSLLLIFSLLFPLKFLPFFVSSTVDHRKRIILNAITSHFQNAL